MDSIRFFFRNLGNNIKRIFINLYRRSYGMDDLNKTLVIVYFVSSILNLILKSSVIYFIGIILFVLFIFRYFSSNKVARADENRVYRKLVKYLKIKWTYRKTHRIYMCKNCKQIIRVPKHQGKIEVTCPSCGAKQIRHS